MQVICNWLLLKSNLPNTVYSSDHKGVGMAHKETSSQKQPHFSLTMMRQYWLGETKPKQAFRFSATPYQSVS